jgi:hypothetical protein
MAMSFGTKGVVDADGNIYNTVTIGTRAEILIAI